MKYFKNAELARLYNVSEKSVRNWIEQTKDGKFDLELWKENGKTFVADTVRNEMLLEEFRHRAKKYRNSIAHKKITPDEHFYALFSPEEVIDIAHSLELYRETTCTYLYHGRGAISWSAYLHKLYGSPNSNIMMDSINLIRHSTPYLYELMKDYSGFNIVDIGAGNGLAAKRLLSDSLATKKLMSYIDIDHSPELADITRHNVESWFEGQVPFIHHKKDVTYERFREVMDISGATANILLLLGGTVKNFKFPIQPLHTIRDSMHAGDILVTSLKQDSATSRRFFDFNVPSEGGDSMLSVHDRLLLDLLNIKPEFYDVEQIFDEKLMARHIQVKLKVDISVIFDTPYLQKTVTIEKGERILLWRVWHYTPQEAIALHEQAGFEVLQHTQTRGRECMLIISRVKTGQDSLE